MKLKVCKRESERVKGNKGKLKESKDQVKKGKIMPK